MKAATCLAPLLQAFFIQRLMSQRQASRHTIASYRDAFRLLLRFAQERLRKSPSELLLDDVDAPFIVNFLEHLEKSQGNCARSRNSRLAAIHSFFRFVALEEPAHSAHIQRVLAIPAKRFDRKPINFLTRPEIEALLASPNQRTHLGRRDHAIILLAVVTGLRVSELVGLRCRDIVLGSGAHVNCLGKGRKERATPLLKQAVQALTAWLKERGVASEEPLFTNARGGPLSTDGVRYLLAKHVARARSRCATLQRKHVSPHVLRHSNAMQLLLAGIDRSVIALLLGHESVETTQMYLNADLELKERILRKVSPYHGQNGRFTPGDQLLNFLSGL